MVRGFSGYEFSLCGRSSAVGFVKKKRKPSHVRHEPRTSHVCGSCRLDEFDSNPNSVRPLWQPIRSSKPRESDSSPKRSYSWTPYVHENRRFTKIDNTIRNATERETSERTVDIRSPTCEGYAAQELSVGLEKRYTHTPSSQLFNSCISCTGTYVFWRCITAC